MILTCPNCETRFLLAAQVLAPVGRTVKCSNCSEEWFELPDPDELLGEIEEGVEQESAAQEEAEHDDIPKGVKPEQDENSEDDEGPPEFVLPNEDEIENAAVKARKNILPTITGYGAALVVFFLVLGALVSVKGPVIQTWPPMSGLYQALGVHIDAPGESLVFDKVTAQVRETETILVAGEIINLSTKEDALPAIEISIRTVEGEVIDKALLIPPSDTLAGEGALPFKSVYKGDTETADHVQLRFVFKKGDKAGGKTISADVEPAPEESPKTVSEDGDNIQAPLADDPAGRPDDEAR